jgi:argininosuccinate lyase
VNPEGGLYRTRLGEALPKPVKRYISSMETDIHFLEHEVRSSQAHTLALLRQGSLNISEAKAILEALQELIAKADEIKVSELAEYEDIHEFVESYVIRKAGEAGKKMHTGRSRNDQVATITRMKVREGLILTANLLLKLIKILVKRAEKETTIPIVYYTHLQHAQIGSLGHYWLAQAESFIRDLERIIDAYERVNRSPLGASACGGSRIDVDRNYTARQLGFDSLIDNSLDAVTSRDFVFEAIAVLANLMINVSRLCQDLILWASREFNYVSLSDRYASTSSIMPQKKNPDTLELAKAKCSEVIGLLVMVGDILRGLPSGYNRELQQVKPPIIQAFQVVSETLEILTGVVLTLQVNTSRIRESLTTTDAYAIELVEWLVDVHKIPLRTAHSAVANLIRRLTGSGGTLRHVSKKELVRLLRKSGLRIDIRGELHSLFDPWEALRQRKTLGSPNPSETRRLVKTILAKAHHLKTLIRNRQRALQSAQRKLSERVASILAAQ